METIMDTLEVFEKVLPHIEGMDNREFNRLVIDRRYWSRGDTELIANMLLSVQDSGTVGLCCLGFDCLQAGISPKLVLSEVTPYDVVIKFFKSAPEKEIPPRIRRLLRPDGDGHNNATAFLMRVNDVPVGFHVDALDTILSHRPPTLRMESEALREEIIAELFSTLGVTVEFVN